MNRRLRLLSWLAGGTDALAEALAVSAVVDDGDGWRSIGGRPHDLDTADADKLYHDALTAWRKNPIARRSITITTDYVVGSGIFLSSPDEHLQKFIDVFWHHPKNLINGRLESMSDELSRAGDLFPTLHRNPVTGVSYVRFLTRDQIERVETLKSDWEDERYIIQKSGDAIGKGTRWYTAGNPRSHRRKAVALHYHISRPIGAMFGESDLAVAIPWLLRYSRMLEDRIKLHWAARAYLWFVKVGSGKVAETAVKYASPPESGSIIVHDDGEEWSMQSPNLRGADADHDMQAVRNMLDAASGQPPHWRGEDSNVNLSTGSAMQGPTERHLERRQQHFAFILQDIVYQAYVRANQLKPDLWPTLETAVYTELFVVVRPEVSKSDNALLADAANKLSAALGQLEPAYGKSTTFKRKALGLIFKFAGEPLSEKDTVAIMEESEAEKNGKNN